MWRGHTHSGAVPVHMVPGELGFDALVLRLANPAIALTRVAASPAIVMSSASTAAALSSSAGCLLVLAVVLALRARTDRSAAAPLLEDAVWFGGLATVGLGVHGGPIAPFALATAAAGLGLATLLALQVAFWGRSSRFWITARPEFQVFAPNPDNRYAVGRIRIAQDSVVATVPDNGSPYPAIGVYDTRFRRVALARWDEVRALFDAHGTLRVHVGPTRSDDAHLSFAVPPGRYYLTVRNYLCDRPESPSLPEFEQ